MQDLFSELVYLLLEARCVVQPAKLERVASLRVSRVRVYRSRAKVGQIERAMPARMRRASSQEAIPVSCGC